MDGVRLAVKRGRDAAQFYFDNARANGALLRDPKRAIESYKPFDATTLRDALVWESDGAVQHLFVGRAMADRKFDPCGLTLMFALATQIYGLNAFVATAAEKGVSDRAREIQTLGTRLTPILYSARMLVEMFDHVLAVSADSEMARYVPTLAGLSLKTPLSPDETAKIEVRLEAAVGAYRARLAAADNELRAMAFDGAVMAQLLETRPPCDYPVWLTYHDHPGAQLINDVWFPQQFAKPMLRKLALAQAQSIVENRPGQTTARGP